MGEPEIRHATVVFGGGPNDAADVSDALAGVRADLVIAADSGLEVCTAAGLRCDFVVGDMDSVDPALLESARRSGSQVRRYDTDKDSTDLELALDLAAQQSVPGSDLLVVASPQGRLDHLLGSALIVGSPKYSRWNVEAFLGHARLLPVHHRRTIGAEVGTTASILALHGRARGVEVTGMRWDLHDADLDASTTLGVSNRFTSAEATVAVAQGVLSVVIPGEPADVPQAVLNPDEPH